MRPPKTAIDNDNVINDFVHVNSFIGVVVVVVVVVVVAADVVVDVNSLNVSFIAIIGTLLSRHSLIAHQQDCPSIRRITFSVYH